MTELPLTMNVVAIKQPGDPNVLQIETRPVPIPLANEILIKVHAAGINRPDVFQRLGKYPPPHDAPDYPGLEVAGTVAKIGSNVTRYKTGDRVCALLAGGGYAEYAIAHSALTLPMPVSLGYIEAAALPETVFTVWSNLFDIGRLKKDEWLLVHGGTSGIGTMAIQMAKAFGAKVVTTAGSDEKCQFCLKLGADYAINYRTDDFVGTCKTATSGKGVNLILDMVGGSYTAKNHEVASMDGRIVQIATLQGSKAEIDLKQIMQKRLWHTGSTLRPRSILEKQAIAESVEQHIWPLLENGMIRPIIDTVLPLSEAAKAHGLMEESNHIGKIMLSTESLPNKMRL